MTVSVTITDDATSRAGFSGWGGYGPGDRPAQLAFPITVSYATSDNTAIADEDYGASNGTLTFQGSLLSQAVSIPIVIDDTDEPTETFTITLSDLLKDTPTNANASIDGAAATISIAGTATQTLAATLLTTVSVSTDREDPATGDSVTMTAQISNPPDGTPKYRWQRLGRDDWDDTPETGDTKSVRFDTAGTRTYRVSVTHPDGNEITSEAIAITWRDPS